MVSPLSAFLSSSSALSMVDALFKPLSPQDTGTATASTPTPSVSSTSSSSDKVTSAAIAAIQALVTGGTRSSSPANASNAAQGSQSLPDWYTATGTTTFTPLNSTKSVTMPTDEYDWYKDNGMPQTLDELKTNVYQQYTPEYLQSLIDSNTAQGDQVSANFYTSMLNAEKSGTVKFELIDPSVAAVAKESYSVIRGGDGHIIGGSVSGGGATEAEQTAFNNLYNDNSRWYAPGSNPFIDGYVISWPKN